MTTDEVVKQGPLAGVRVLDMTRLAPGPYGSMLLADLGAEVIVIGGGRSGLPVPALSRGKQFITLDLKSNEGQAALHHLVADADVLLEGFRPGVAERIGAGYEELRQLNPQLVYCSLTGYGQTGTLAQRAGHDINYAAMAGALGTFGPVDGPPVPPLNLLADFAGGGMLAVIGIMSALIERQKSGIGQHIDAAMVDGVMSMMGMNFSDWHHPTLPRRGHGIVSGAAPFYRCYPCADGRWVAVGALEDAFFANLWNELDLGEVVPNHWDPATWPTIEQRLRETFVTRDMQEWADQFAGVDACVTPVLEPHELAATPHIRERHPNFTPTNVPTVPRLSRTPPIPGSIDISDVTAKVLLDRDVDPELAQSAAAAAHEAATGLSWPPL